MPRVSAERKNFYKAKIRSLIVIDRQMSLREMQSQLEQNGIHLDLHFIGKLRESIDAEKKRRVDRRTLNHALSTVEDTLTETTHLAWQIALNPTAKPQDRLGALREIRKSHTAMFNLLFDSGIFERKLGTLEHEIRRAPLTDEQKDRIRNAFKRWGFMTLPGQENNKV